MLFFFQAEGGIRDTSVTGVQTCALPILRGKTIAFVDPASTSGYVYPMVLLMRRGLGRNRDPKTFFREVVFAGSHDAGMRALRSEERRVGREVGARGRGSGSRRKGRDRHG